MSPERSPLGLRDLDDVGKDGEDVESPSALLDAAAFVEPLGTCGKKVLRSSGSAAEAGYGSNFPTGSIDKCCNFRCVRCGIKTKVSETVEDVYSSLLNTRKKGRKTWAFEFRLESLIERLDYVRKFEIAMEL